MTSQPISIAHDFLVERGGAERVALELLQAFPEATLYTGLYRPHATYPEFQDFDIRQVLTSRMPASGNHRASLPLAISAFGRLRLDAGILVCSTSGLGHLTMNTGKKLVYCHTPARWAHDPAEYFLGASQAVSLAGTTVTKLFKPLDRRRMLGADRILANSDATRTAIFRAYGVSADVIHPVSSLATDGPEEPLAFRPGFWFTPSRLLSYKRVDVILSAASRLPDHRFIIVGEGPIRAKLERAAPPNVTFLGMVTDGSLRWLYRNARAVVLSCAEDFGLVPAEAAAFGTPSVVPDQRGPREQAAVHPSIHEYRFGDRDSLVNALQCPDWDARVAAVVGSNYQDLQTSFRSSMIDEVDKLRGR